MARFAFLGGNLCLDFCNTMNWRFSDLISDLFQQYGDLLEWGMVAGIVTEEEAAILRAEAARRPEEAAAVLGTAREFREALFRVIQRKEEGRPADPVDVERISRVVGSSMAHTRLQPAEGHYTTTWETATDALDRVLWPIAGSALELLTSPALPRARVCEGPGCGWVFLDTTRNRSRRWCSMELCGNRDKVKRFYRRHKEQRHP